MAEHLGDAAGTDNGARQHHRHESAHHDCRQNLEQVLQESRERADVDQPIIHAMTAKPQHRARGHIEDHRNKREHHHEKPADVQGQAGDVLIFFGKALGLIGLAHEGAHHADAGDLLAQGAINGIQLVLHGTEERHEAGNDNGDGAEQNRHGYPYQPGQAGVFAHGHDDAADGHDGCGHHEVQHHHVDHLHLLDVIGATGD